MKIEEAIAELEASGLNTRFNRLVTICQNFFAERKMKGTSHHTFKTPWQGDPRINLQTEKGKAKDYQVRDVLKALRKLQEMQKR